ncbi:MAG: DUF4411 family protein [Gemmatimonadales bacterium]
MVDASIWILIWRHHPPDIFRRLWQQLDQAIAAGDVRSPEEVLHELEQGTDDLAETLEARNGLFLPLDEPLARATEAVQAACPLTDPAGERSRGDPFVVACAQLNGGMVVSGEGHRRAPTAPPKIPDACDQLGVPHLDWFGFLRATGWDL